MTPYAYLTPRGALDRAMHFGDDVRNCTAFLYTARWNGKQKQFEGLPKGTAFFVRVNLDPDAPLDDNLGPFVVYAVTARHCITDCDERQPIYIAVNNKQGGKKPIRTYKRNWKWHKGTDVAICEVGHEFELIAASWIHFSLLVPKEGPPDRHILLGEDVMTIGLYFRFPGKHTIQPVARFGHISLLPNENEKIAIQLDKNSQVTTPVDAYLVEVTSWEGQSGSPVFVSFGNIYEWVTIAGQGVEQKVMIVRPPPLCIGLLHGSWIDELPPQHGSNVVHRMNMGLTPVIPSHRIIEKLMEDELVKERKDRFGKEPKQKPPRPMSLEKQPFTKGKMDDALKRASRKVSEPESKDSQTSE